MYHGFCKDQTQEGILLVSLFVPIGNGEKANSLTIIHYVMLMLTVVTTVVESILVILVVLVYDKIIDEHLEVNKQSSFGGLIFGNERCLRRYSYSASLIGVSNSMVLC